ncbi:MAG: hypothetical protein JWQ27_2858 [Ferruginibacter sp.]|nr:hypothetical protein [Ferruginibacter sp.]
MKKFQLKKVYLFFSTVLIFILHLPFAFSKSKPLNLAKAASEAPNSVAHTGSSSLELVYDSLKLNMKGLSEEAFDYAVKGYEYLRNKGRIRNQNVISIVDFTKPSTQKRLFIIDVKNYKVLFNTYVAHGQNSGKEFARQFSNRPDSYQSSLGFYVTSDTYIGKNGYSMHLIGQESGINDLADERAIVMHGAPYVSESFIRARGFLGRSWGCPAVSEELNRPIIEKIKNGSCLFIYSEDNRYLNQSRILNS